MDPKAVERLYDQFKNDEISQREYDRAIAQLQKDSKGKNKGGGTSIVDGGKDLFSRLLRGSLEQSGAPEQQNDLGSVLSAYNQVKSDPNNQDNSIITNLAKTIGAVATNSMEEYAKQSSFLLGELNAGVGLTGQLSKDFRDSIREGQPDLERLGLTFKEISDAAGELVESTGRFALVGTEMLTRAGEIAVAYGMNMSDVTSAYADFEKVGIGASEAQESIADAGKRSLELGLQSRQTIEGMIDNISKLNEYGFKDGQDGLAEMVRTATRLRFSLESTFTVADKVFEPEGALDLAANLQVLGAAFGDFNDPLKLMYMATNEVEGLQQALAGVSQNLAVYNQETGNFEVTGTNLRMARDIAKQFGIDIKEVTNSAIAAQERAQAALALDGLNISDDNKEFLTNLSRMKDGEMQIELLTPELQKQFGASTVKLSELNNVQAARLKEYQDEFTEMSESDIVRQQATTVENISRDLRYMISLARLQVADVSDTVLKEFVGMDFKDVGSFLSGKSDDATDYVAEGIKGAGKFMIDEIKNAVGNQNTNITQTSTNSNVTGNVTVTHSASNNAVNKLSKDFDKVLNMDDRDLLKTTYRR
jgi:hypothetical protein|tara:strand:+ start:632 stop:2404 length:1773 start_codon:yes stop_codon:yes gene_type:complete